MQAENTEKQKPRLPGLVVMGHCTARQAPFCQGAQAWQELVLPGHGPGGCTRRLGAGWGRWQDGPWHVQQAWGNVCVCPAERCGYEADCMAPL